MLDRSAPERKNRIEFPKEIVVRNTEYAMYTALPGVDYDAAVGRVEAALAEEGFGVLTRIDVSETLRRKIDVDFRPYVILGACNPSLAHGALVEDDNVGVLLPCNVVVAATGDGAEVSIGRPDKMIAMAGNPALGPVAAEADERLRRVLARIAAD